MRTLFALCAVFAMSLAVPAWAADDEIEAPKDTAGFRFDIGIAYVSGVNDVVDAVEDVYTANGFDIDTVKIPVGLVFNPYYEFSNGIGIGGSVGPIVAGWIDTTNGGDDETFVIIPLGLDIRYTFMRDQNVSPYVRGGVRFPIAVGDLVDNGSAGAFGAVGVIFGRQHKVAWGVEAAIDTSEVDVTLGGETETAKPSNFMVTLFIEF